MRSGLVLYRLVFIKNAPVCAGAFFLREIEGVAISGVAARGRSGSAARAGNADIFVWNFLSSAEERGVGTAGFRRRIRGVAV